MNPKNVTYEKYFNLTIPGNIEYLHFVIDSIKSIAQKAQLKHSDYEMLLLGAEEAFTNMTKHAYADKESQPVKITCRISPGEFQLSFFDSGIPFDESIAKKYEPPTGSDLLSTEGGGIGLFLINTIFDEVRWINHGRKGKELYLKKILPLSEPSLYQEPPYSAKAHDEDKTEIIDENSFLIRPFEPYDALKISRCFYKVYGYTFENDSMFYPERFTGLVNKGDIISFVCVDQRTNEIAGHLALVRDKSSQAAEITYAVVAPEYRKHGLLIKLALPLLESAYKSGIAGFSANATAHHVFSQKAALKEFAVPCAIVLGYFSVERTFKKIGNEHSDKRISALFMFKYLKPPKPVDLHLPDRHRELIETIYGKLEAPFNLPESTDITLKHGEMSVYMDKMFKSSKIIVDLVGEDTLTEISRAKNDLCDAGGAEVVYLYLPLNQPRTKTFCNECENMGFFFSGIEPKPGGMSDMLRLQHLNSEIDFSMIQLQDDFSKKLLDYVNSEYKRILKFTY
jgi:anti-sigma regulatory factor (Ser/Thr protein kinase)